MDQQSQPTQNIASIPAIQASPNQNTTNPSKTNPKMMYIVSTIIIVFLVGACAFFFITKQTPKKNPTLAQQPTTQTIPSTPATPVVSPVTASNVDQTLNNTDATMQQTINQANDNLTSVSTIDTSQDSTSGL